jgi:hypothetical protein
MTSSKVNAYDDFVDRYGITTYEEEYMDIDDNHYDEEDMYYSDDEIIDDEGFDDF